MKRFIIAVSVIILIVILSIVINQKNASVNESNNSTTEDKTQTNENVNDEDSNKPFTKEEIDHVLYEQMAYRKGVVDHVCYIVDFAENRIDYNTGYIFVMEDDYIVGYICVIRENGKIVNGGGTWPDSDEDIDHSYPLTDLLHNSLDHSFAFVKNERSLYAIRDDNRVTKIYGEMNLPNDSDSIYENYNKGDNIISWDILNCK